MAPVELSIVSFPDRDKDGRVEGDVFGIRDERFFDVFQIFGWLRTNYVRKESFSASMRLNFSSQNEPMKTFQLFTKNDILTPSLIVFTPKLSVAAISMEVAVEDRP